MLFELQVSIYLPEHLQATRELFNGQATAQRKTRISGESFYYASAAARILVYSNEPVYNCLHRLLAAIVLTVASAKPVQALVAEHAGMCI